VISFSRASSFTSLVKFSTEPLIHERYIYKVIDKNYDYKHLKRVLKKSPNAFNDIKCNETSPLHYFAGACPWEGTRFPIKPQSPKRFTQLLLSKAPDKIWWGYPFSQSVWIYSVFRARDFD